MKLTKDELYYTSKLKFESWTDGDGTGAVGYYWEAYFQDHAQYDLASEDTLLEYLGPDDRGIEPEFEETSAMEA